MHPKWLLWKHRAPKIKAPTGSIATPKSHLGVIPLLGPHNKAHQQEVLEKVAKKRQAAKEAPQESQKLVLNLRCYSWAGSKRGTERGVFAFACQYVVSPDCLPDRQRYYHTNATSRPFLKDDQNRARQSLASAVSVRRVAAAWYCHPGRPANVVTPLFVYLLFKLGRYSASLAPQVPS